jgi:hypothetical protein
LVEPFSDEALRISANLEQRHDAWVTALRRLDRLPSSMFFVAKAGADYLTIKRYPGDSGTTLGARSPETEKRLEDFQHERAEANAALAQTEAALVEIVRQYRALRLPLIMPRPARILRELDRRDLLGIDLMLVGSNAFVAYEIEAGCRFLGGLAETEDFDLAWCRGTRIALARRTQNEAGSPLMRALQAVDASYRLNERKPYQAVDRAGYEVELLVAPSLFRTVPKDELFSPMAAFPEQEWLLQGRGVRHVVVDRENRTCPIFAPDPRWMALHKLWLAQKPERSAVKRPKDLRQGNLLLDAVRSRMQVGYPLDLDFVLALPGELRELFNQWAASRGFTPT